MNIKQAMLVGFLKQGPVKHSDRSIARVVSELHPSLCPKKLSGNQMAGSDLVFQAQHELEEWNPQFKKWSLYQDFNLNWGLIAEISTLLSSLEQQSIIDISTKEHSLMLESIYNQINDEITFDWDEILRETYELMGWTWTPDKEVVKEFKSYFPGK